MFLKPLCSTPVALLGATVAIAASGVAWAQDERGDKKSGATHLVGDVVDDVFSNLSSLKIDSRSLFKLDPFGPLRGGMKRLNNELDRAARIRIGFAWTTLYQHASDADGPEDAASGDFDFFGRWRALQTRETLGYVIFATEARYSQITDIPPRGLGDSIGSLWGTVNAFNIHSFELKQIYWQQFLFNNRVSYRLGKLDLTTVFNTNRLESDNLYFLNAAFSDNPTLPYGSTGPGADVTWRAHRFVYVGAGIADTPGSFEFFGEKNLGDTSWFAIAEIGLTPWIDGVGAGKYRFTGWFADASDSSEDSDSAGFALSCDQDIGSHVIAFLRYGYSDGNLTDTKQIVAGGFGVKKPLGDNDDFAGIAAAWGDPTDQTLRDQVVVELFYRIQVTPSIQLTPDFQLILNPSNTTNRDVVGVFGIRARVTF